MKTTQFKRLLSRIGTLTGSKFEGLRTAVGDGHTQRSCLQISILPSRGRAATAVVSMLSGMALVPDCSACFAGLR